MQLTQLGAVMLGAFIGGVPLVALFEYLRWHGNLALTIILAGALAGTVVAWRVIGAYPHLFGNW